jgi:periplasmic mercuric ion binding protein
MKRLLYVALAVIGFSFSSGAQTKAVQTVKISTPSVQCDMCKTRIESTLKRYDGVLSANVNYKKKETTVKYISERINEETIKTAIANAGYDANEIKATEDAYKTLPKCCKKPVEKPSTPKQ